ncbi:MAG: sigma-70 family RNA polymerase sigma factor [Clostridiales bacterium]|nr:sigma-70 family RNA polymerase sigma factor [Clostridiales bacterium]
MNKLEIQKLSDEELVSLAEAKDERAIDELFDRYKYIASAVAHSYFLNGGDSEDLLQEGLFAVFKAITSFNAKSSFKTYVYTCVKNRIFNVIKSSNRYKNQPLNNYISLSGAFDNEGDADKTEIIVDKHFGPEEIFINAEAENELKDIINSVLSKFEHEILVYYLKGYSYREISEKVEKKEKSIDNAIQRIRKKIILALNSKG